MDNRTIASLAVATALACTTIAGCSERSPTSPTQAAPSATSSSVTVTAVQPNSGSTNGTTIVRIVGTGFEPGAAVTLGAIATAVTVVNNTTITATVPTHAAGLVDVIVTNPGGQSGRLNGGFTYISVPRAIVAAVWPDIGSTEGGTIVTITGTDFRAGVTVTLGGIEIRPTVYQGSIYLVTPPHAAGPVDVVVTNGGADADVLVNGYTYAPPESFDFNGIWEGGAGSEQEIPLEFTIQNDFVTSMRCGSSEALTFTTEIPVRNGSFSFSDEVRGTISGRIVSAVSARGAVDTASCRNTSWYVQKR